MTTPSAATPRKKSWPSMAALLPLTAFVVACDNQGPNGGTLTLAQTAYTVSESGDRVTVTVVRTGKNLTRASVRYTASASASAGSADADRDFAAVSGTLEWAVGEAGAKTFDVPILPDLAIEGSESFTVTLADAQIAALGEPSSATVTITDDDRLGDTVGLAGAQLVTFDLASPGVATSAATLSGLAAGETLLGLDRRPADGALIALSSAGKLYTLDAASGALTLKSTLVPDATDTSLPYSLLPAGPLALDFNPVPDRLRVVARDGANLRINVDTGAVITDGAINGASTGYAAAAYATNYAAACRTSLYAIDVASGELYLQNPPNDGTAVRVGILGLPATAVADFDIVTDAAGVDTAYAALTVSGEQQLYTINLRTGGAGLPRSLPPAAADYSAIVLPVEAGARPQAAGDTLGLTAGGKLVTFNRAAPAKLCTSAAVTGLAAGEMPVGLDTRPADGQVYVLSSASKLYTLDRATAALTLKSTLSTPLAGTDFGVDFNPVPDRLRVVSDSGQNLRINVDTGATTVDGALSTTAGAVGATAVAYTNSLKGGDAATLTTTTYYLDTGSRPARLLTSTNPNAGALTVVGSLGLDLGGLNGFDINGSDNTATIAVDASGTATTLRTIDLATGAVSAPLGTVGGGERLVGLTAAAAPATATVYGLTADNRLVRFLPSAAATPTTVGPLSGLQGGEAVLGLDFRPSTGQLYALTDAGRLYKVDPATAALAPASTLAADAGDLSAPFAALPAAPAFGIDFNPTGPVALRIVSSLGDNLRVANPDAGNTFTDTALGYGSFAASAAAYTNSFAGTATTSLFVLDAARDRLFLQAPPNDGVLKDRGPLGVDASAVAGFDIVGMGAAYALLDVGGVVGLYSVDVGAAFSAARATLIGTLGAAGTLRGLAIPVATSAPADPLLYTTLSAAGTLSLARFTASAPGALSVVAPITGLGVGETPVDLDFRPATGALYALTDAGVLYTVDTATGVATLASRLAADVADLTAPFIGLAGARTGIDFNPVPDRLRVISDVGQNLRINVDSGATTTDGTLVRVPAAAAAAYTNSFRGASATQLFVIDASSAGLALQAPPNDGVLTSVNSLGVNLTDLTAVGFDIAGGANGFALAALVTDGATASSLYRINLGTGQATLVGPIGTPTPLRALTVQIQ